MVHLPELEKKNGEIEKRAEKINPKRKKEGRSLS